MSDLPDFDRILFLIEHHGQPKDCEIKKCSVCKEIIEARASYSGDIDDRRPNNFKPTKKFKYTLIDENNIKTIFSMKSDVLSFLKTSAPTLNPYINTGKRFRGYIVQVEQYIA